MEIRELKAQLPKARSILAFDYGEKRLGVAVSDLLLMTANPLKIIYRSTFDKDLAQIKQIIEEKDVCRQIACGDVGSSKKYKIGRYAYGTGRIH